MISLIAAASRNNVIGARGAIPWRLSTDLKRFKALTMGKPVVMGRLTNESIGQVLPGRQNIVITSRPDYCRPGCHIVRSPEAALEAAGDAEEIMIIGGGKIYEQFLPLSARIYLTRVLAEIAGDAFFPELNSDDWELSSRESHQADERNEFDVEFLILERRPQHSST